MNSALRPKLLRAGLARHLIDCRRASGRWHRLQLWGESLHAGAQPRFVTSLALVGLIAWGLASWLA